MKVRGEKSTNHFIVMIWQKEEGARTLGAKYIQKKERTG